MCFQNRKHIIRNYNDKRTGVINRIDYFMWVGIVGYRIPNYCVASPFPLLLLIVLFQKHHTTYTSTRDFNIHEYNVVIEKHMIIWVSKHALNITKCILNIYASTKSKPHPLAVTSVQEKEQL